MAYWAGQLQSGAISIGQLNQALANAARENGQAIKVTGYASGGDFSGGLRLVGENGPELEVTGPSRIYNANQTASMLNGGNNANLVVELRAIRAELESVKANTEAGALNGGKLVRTLDRVTDGGNAMQTKVAS
jgi:hypothetical protein